MTFDDLAAWTRLIGERQKLSASVKAQVAKELPVFLRELSSKTAPPRWKLPTGESLSDATRLTAMRCHCLLLARTVFGANYIKADPEYEALARVVLFGVMRHAFNTSDPKGVFCCPPCTLSLLPLYAASCFKWVDCAELKANVIGALERGESVFRRSYPKAYAEWVLGLSRGR